MASKQLSTSASEVIPANLYRKSLVIQNQDTTDSVFIKKEAGELLTVTATDHDIKLGPGASMGLATGQDGTDAIQARYTGIASANTPRISVFESEDIKR